MKRSTVNLVGGPFGALTFPAAGESESICHRRGIRPWGHYRRESGNRYRYVGPCVEHHTVERDLDEDVCCCGNPACGWSPGGSGYRPPLGELDEIRTVVPLGRR